MTTRRSELVSLVSRWSRFRPNSPCDFKGESKETSKTNFFLEPERGEKKCIRGGRASKTRFTSLRQRVGLIGLMDSPYLTRGNCNFGETTRDQKRAG